MKGVNALLHIASPLAAPPDDFESSVVQPALQGTMNILKGATKSPSIRRIVITSSIVAVVPWVDFLSAESDHIFTADERIVDPEPP